MSKKLSEYYKGAFVPEFARDYLQQKWENKKQICTPEDILPIAQGQIELENNAVNSGNKMIFCDTDLLETKVYSEAYFEGWCDLSVTKAALGNSYDLYFLTYIDIPWEADDLRDRPDQRQEMFDLFEQALIENDRRYVLLKGNIEQRLNTAINQINNLLL
ncbi:ATP-binding protein [Leeuwenhoekiella aequorea]|uniref:Nicotinamide riboside kinase n=1 Tax=Leeuwenhoekiella aequorea TaxID=283736 RepID=A0A4Q0P6G6_9FLAO|nr:ATP-binding protein [Leeuwenhoekiella aequorea]RXG22061.1 nicotinamide riboside kinase [Leeuwenhoekiella aequorea]